jgi:hypothetical protein
VALLTSIISDADGNPMYRINHWSGGTQYYSRNGKVGVDLAWMDEQIGSMFASSSLPHMVRQLVPGDNKGDEIARLRQDRTELDDMAADYDERHAELTAKIRELVRQDAENPNPDRIEMVDSGKTLGEVWQGMSTAERRDLLLEHDTRVTWRGDGWSFDAEGFSLRDGALSWTEKEHSSTLRERALRAYADSLDTESNR